MKIGIVNYSIGNVGSVYSALRFYGYDVVLANEARDLEDMGMLILAGVGNFPTAVSRLRKLNLWEQINTEVLIKKKPVLGICLGMQLFADTSNEDGLTYGFGWIKGEVVKLEGLGLRVPHIGWNEVRAKNSKIFSSMRYNYFYFMHSYHFVPLDKNVILATTNYGNTQMVSAVRSDNIVGVQFHPEKSQGDGLRLLRNIIETLK